MLIYLGAGTFICTVVLMVANNRMDDRAKKEPLRDLAFDIIKERQTWTFKIVELWGLFVTVLFFAMVAVHKHRMIILRRLGFIVGTLYFYRALTMLVTSLPVPGTHLKCVEQQLDTKDVIINALKFLAGGGMTITGAHHYCGDYLYSGHTAVILTGSNFLSIYLPDKLGGRHSSRFFRYFKKLIMKFSYFACVLILASHDHYTIDIVCAYFVTTTLIYTYHSGIVFKTMYQKVEEREDLEHHYLGLRQQEESTQTSSNQTQSASPPRLPRGGDRDRDVEMQNSVTSRANAINAGSQQISPNSNSLLITSPEPGSQAYLTNVISSKKLKKIVFYHKFWWWRLFCWLEKHEVDALVTFELDDRLRRFFKRVR